MLVGEGEVPPVAAVAAVVLWHFPRSTIDLALLGRCDGGHSVP